MSGLASPVATRARRRPFASASLGSCLFLLALGCESAPTAGVLLISGTVFNGSGGAPRRVDVALSADRVSFVGDAIREGVQAADTVDVTGLMVTPGFIDMHSHAVLSREYARDGLAFLHQGITTVVDGADGGGDPEIAARLRGYVDSGIGVNAVEYVGHGAVRRAVMGMEDRAPTGDELERMKALVRQGMEEGAFGFSTGLFYTPGYYVETEEVIELAPVAAEYGGLYDTHDRDLGASYQGVGYLASIREAIRVGEESGARVIFTGAQRPHFGGGRGRLGCRRTNCSAAYHAGRQCGRDEPRPIRYREHAIPRDAAVDDDLHRRADARARTGHHPPAGLRRLHPEAPTIRPRRGSHLHVVRDPEHDGAGCRLLEDARSRVRP